MVRNIYIILSNILKGTAFLHQGVTNYLQVFLMAIDIKYYPEDIVQSMYKRLAPVCDPWGTLGNSVAFVDILRLLSPEGWGTRARFEHY